MWERFYSIFLFPLLGLGILFLLEKHPGGWTMQAFQNVPMADLASAFMQTFLRLLIAYSLALLVSVPLAIAASKNAIAEKVLLPLFDIVQSVPVLTFFPIIIALFLKFGLYDWSAIFVLFLSMVWNIVFSIVGGLKTIPNDIKDAAHVFHIHGYDYTTHVMLPAIVPYLVTGSLLAWAQGWNLIIVAEVLHTYIPGGDPSQDVFGIGSVMVHAAANGQGSVFMTAVVLMVVGIALMNFFVWQRLLHYAERFKFE